MGAEIDALLWALFDAQAAFYAGNFAGFDNTLPAGVAVGAQDYRPFLIFGYAFQKALGTFGHTHAAAGAFCVINYWQPFLRIHADGVEFAHVYAVAKAKTPPGA
jgi:hypothetical protein